MKENLKEMADMIEGRIDNALLPLKENIAEIKKDVSAIKENLVHLGIPLKSIRMEINRMREIFKN